MWTSKIFKKNTCHVSRLTRGLSRLNDHRIRESYFFEFLNLKIQKFKNSKIQIFIEKKNKKRKSCQCMCCMCMLHMHMQHMQYICNACTCMECAYAAKCSLKSKIGIYAVSKVAEHDYLCMCICCMHPICFPCFIFEFLNF